MRGGVMTTMNYLLLLGLLILAVLWLKKIRKRLKFEETQERLKFEETLKEFGKRVRTLPVEEVMKMIRKCVNLALILFVLLACAGFCVATVNATPVSGKMNAQPIENNNTGDPQLLKWWVWMIIIVVILLC